jgi:hypothetical protein
VREILLIVVSCHVVLTANAFGSAITSEVMLPDQSTVTPLLRAVCPDGIRTEAEDGKRIFGCGDELSEITSAPMTRGHSWSDSVQWRADGIIFGHFLSATSDDVAVSGAGAAETHPYLWGGTLLLTRKNGEWTPVWYKMGVVTRHCRRVPVPDGRQILFCDETDGGMGHALHFLYTVDFLKPVRA